MVDFGSNILHYFLIPAIYLPRIRENGKKTSEKCFHVYNLIIDFAWRGNIIKARAALTDCL
jgi:hypothetical protein